MITEITGKTIAIAILDWGLGHATRMIPVIKSLLKNNNKIIIASSGNAGVFLCKEFPQLQYYELPSYKIVYSKSDKQFLTLILQIPHIHRVIKQEHLLIEQIAKKENINLIISDNRFGCYSSDIESLYITHQLSISLPKRLNIFSNIANRLNAYFINRYNACLIPDDKNLNLTSEFQNNPYVRIPLHFIGLLSRLKVISVQNKRYDFLCVISGPEPQRSILENLIIHSFGNSKYKIALIRGTYTQSHANHSNIEIFNIVNTSEFEYLLSVSEFIICRSGYSSVMDLFKINRKAILVPTPGQYEQMKLAEVLEQYFDFKVLKQHEISLSKIVDAI